MEKVQKPSNSVCYVPSSEPFRIYLFCWCSFVWRKYIVNKRTEVCNLLLGNEILGKESVARSRNNRTAVLRNRFLGNGSINTLPRIRNNMGRCVFFVVRAEGLSWRQLGRPRQLVVGSFQVNARRSEQINSGTSGGNKRIETRSIEEYKRSACEDVKCD
jgi:hypothetical protein